MASVYSGHARVFDAVWAPVVFIWLLRGQLGRVRRAGRITTIRIAVAIPTVRVLALPVAPPSPARDSGGVPPTRLV